MTALGSAAAAASLWPHGKLFAGTPIPTLLEQQQAFLDLRFGMLSNFNMSTFQDREWADPAAAATVFAPRQLDIAQWATVARSANMTWGCLSVKHHDGFCLWPTATDSVSVRQAGVPDVVRAYVDAYRTQGLKVGFQFSMLDMRQRIERYSVTAEKVALIKEQLRELLTNYGDIAVLIFEGWNTPWARLSYDILPFHEIYQHVKALQPNCLICELNGIRYPGYGLYYTDIKPFKANSGQVYPVVSGAPGCAIMNLNHQRWFWHQRDLNTDPIPVKTVVDQWLTPFNDRRYTVLLNVPPNRDGQLSSNFIRRLGEIGAAWKHPGPAVRLVEHPVVTTASLLRGKPIQASPTVDAYGADMLNDGDDYLTWVAMSNQRPGWAEVDLGETRSFNMVSFAEGVGRRADYPVSRVKSFAFKRWDGSTWVTFASGTTVKAGTILRVPRVSAQRIRFEVDTGNVSAWISEISVYDEPDLP